MLLAAACSSLRHMPGNMRTDMMGNSEPCTTQSSFMPSCFFEICSATCSQIFGLSSLQAPAQAEVARIRALGLSDFGFRVLGF